MQGQNLRENSNGVGSTLSLATDQNKVKAVASSRNENSLDEGATQNSKPRVLDGQSRGEDTATVTFVDPIGTRWLFSYEVCQTWEGVLDLITEVFRECAYPEYFIEILQGKHSSVRSSFSIEMIGDGEQKRTVVLQAHWEKIIKPGSVIAISFTGYTKLVNSILDGVEFKRQEKEEEEKRNNRSTSGENESQPRSYLVQYYERYNEWQTGALLKEESYPEPPQFNKGKNTPAILDIITKVFIPETNAKKKLDPARLDDSDTVGYPILRVNSPELRNALKDIIKSTSPLRNDIDSASLDDTERSRDTKSQSDLNKGVFMFPYEDLYHYKHELSEYMKSSFRARKSHSLEYNEKCDKHIQVLLDYLNEQPLIGFQDAEDLWSQKVPKVRFHSVWLLLKPGTTVFVREKFGLNAYVIDRVEGGSYAVRSRAGDRDFKVVVWNLEYDGKFLRRCPKIVKIPVFGEEREISSLPLFPTKFLRDDGNHQEDLIKRGKQYINAVIEPSFHEYSGSSHFYGTRKFNQVRVVVDHISRPWESEIKENLTHLTSIHVPGESSGYIFQEDYDYRYDYPARSSTENDDSIGSYSRTPACECDTCQSLPSGQRSLERAPFDDYKNIELTSQPILKDHQYLICFSHVYGFLLKDRIWDLIEVRGLQRPDIQERAIDDLVLDSSKKEIIRALCETYSDLKRKEHLFADIIRGKGEGQIMLLHGPPGTGKTLTAESVAEYTRRPLLSVTAADLGHETETLERKLLKFFRNAARWDAVLLLDEADVYLQRRSLHDLHRNGIVSVFLRALDYFQGLLFITTNRVGTFDEAFMSRIHLHIGYDNLDRNAQIKVWEINLERLKSNNRNGGRKFDVDYQVKKYIKNSPDLMEQNWNGREIRNAFQTAVALASFQAKNSGREVPELTEEHIDQVVAMSQNFKNYMKETWKGSPEELAAQSHLRADQHRDNQVAVSQFRPM